jgi:hypothetical protein
MKAHEEHIPSEILSRIGKENGFVLPHHYFDTFPDKVNQLLLLEKTKEEGFVTPVDYFETLPERILQRTQLPKAADASAPNSYFEDLPQRIQARIYEEEKRKEWKILPAIPTWSYALAASICLLIGIGVWMKPQTVQVAHDTKKPHNTPACLVKKKENIQVQVSTETKEVIQQHVEEQLIEQLDENLLLDELNNQSTPGELALESKEINDYLLENNIDETLLEDAVH